MLLVYQLMKSVGNVGVEMWLLGHDAFTGERRIKTAKMDRERNNKTNSARENRWSREDGMMEERREQMLISFWSLGLPLPASSCNAAGAALSLTTEVRRQRQLVHTT